MDVYVSLNDKHVGPEVGSLYTYRVNLDGDYELIAVPDGTYTANSGRTNFDIQQAYKDGATLNNDWYLEMTQAGYVKYKSDNGYGYVGSKSGGYAGEYNVAIEIDNAFDGLKYYKLAIDTVAEDGSVTYAPRKSRSILAILLWQ